MYTALEILVHQRTAGVGGERRPIVPRVDAGGAGEVFLASPWTCRWNYEHAGSYKNTGSHYLCCPYEMLMWRFTVRKKKKREKKSTITKDKEFGFQTKLGGERETGLRCTGERLRV